MSRRRFRVSGVVQGVGFRPFVYGLATRRGLGGFVLNDGNGVVAEVEGEAKAIGVACNVADAASVEAAVARVLDELGGFHVLVNNAGITRDNLLFKLTEDDWDAVMDVHLKGAFLMSKAAQKTFVAQKYGKILNLSSVSANGNRGQANYSAAKAGVQGFTRTLALELGPFGVNVNAIAPPINSASARSTSASNTPSLSDTFAPPRTVTYGRSGSVRSRPRTSSRCSTANRWGWCSTAGSLTIGSTPTRSPRCIRSARGRRRSTTSWATSGSPATAWGAG